MNEFYQGLPYSRHQPLDFFSAYLDEASIVVNRADRSWPEMFKFCRELADAHFFHVFAVIYLTPPNSFAVRAHSDDQGLKKICCFPFFVYVTIMYLMVMWLINVVFPRTPSSFSSGAQSSGRCSPPCCQTPTAKK